MFAQLLTSALAFNGPVARPRASASKVVMAQSDFSKAIPFVPKPEALNGELLCDIGFDPVGFTKGKSLATITKYREAELKHGRLCMLAVTGYLVQEAVSPFQKAPFNEANPINALGMVPAFGIAQIILAAGLIEYNTQGYEGRIPGDVGFDPLGLSKDGIKEEWAVAEIKHGRLAMIAFLAFQFQLQQSGKPIIADTFEIFTP